MPKKLPPDLMKELNKAAFKDKARDYEKMILQLSPEELLTAIPDRAAFYKAIEEVAFNKNAATFEKMLEKFSDDEQSVRAILKGFKRDEAYCSQSGDGRGMPSGADSVELDKKRQALQEFILLLSRKNSACKPIKPGL